MANKRLANVFGRITGVFQAPNREKTETDYLNGSVSLYDLERRQREIERGKFRSF
jgi:Protein of unknown function (DUF3563)